MRMLPDPIGDSADDGTGGDGARVGPGDHEADIARSRGEPVSEFARSDSDGVPVGAEDADADAERSGGDRAAP